MKIIFSRKGFDSSAGGIPSPILPDGTLISLPIPSEAGTSAHAIETPVGPLDVLLDQLGHIATAKPALYHLDPDLSRKSISRHRDWAPSFGQVGHAQSHLRRQGVGVDDLFLFFGWFRKVEVNAQGHFQYIRGERSIHSLFGWLRVSQLIRIEESLDDDLPRWLATHPHVAFRDRFKGRDNTIYSSSTPIRATNPLSTGGIFSKWSPTLQLTAEGRSRSIWSLPSWLYPRDRTPLSYHQNAARWQFERENVLLSTVGRGQEFVLDADEYPEAAHWASDIVARHA